VLLEHAQPGRQAEGVAAVVDHAGQRCGVPDEVVEVEVAGGGLAVQRALPRPVEAGQFGPPRRGVEAVEVGRDRGEVVGRIGQQVGEGHAGCLTPGIERRKVVLWPAGRASTITGMSRGTRRIVTRLAQRVCPPGGSEALVPAVVDDVLLHIRGLPPVARRSASSTGSPGCATGVAGSSPWATPRPTRTSAGCCATAAGRWRWSYGWSGA
jgi:hypothetical protein